MDAFTEAMEVLNASGFTSGAEEWRIVLQEKIDDRRLLIVARIHDAFSVTKTSDVIKQIRIDLILDSISKKKSERKRMGGTGYFTIGNGLADTVRTHVHRLMALVDELRDVRCPYCGSLMSEKCVSADGPHKGERFLGCINWPDCKGMRAPWRDGRPHDDGKPMPDVPCPECGAPTAVRYAKRGPHAGNRFLGCTNYPTCARVVTDDEAAAIKLMRPDPSEAPHPIEKAPSLADLRGPVSKWMQRPRRTP